ncbi:MAG: trypsin-like peptidase domain-containing protein [Deltaproteobacteria bacterium]|nr:trypsin-like peptidase domain-containing protein [Deltaproteobacteria bacterium]MBW2317214.1 trypsin-like peptidase domain-containing protein [Deltaproteobacteria bacterium]MBW2600417.1 trypsin-like peptidase domain-containing protein [Deltaproteobacteria bacterium]
MAFRHIQILKVTAFIFLVVAIADVSALADPENRSKTYPLPVAELEELITDRFERSGFEVTRTALKMGQVRLKGTKATRCRQIILTPHSALATDVYADYPVNNASEDRHVKELWDLISKYVSGETTVRSQNENTQQVIPSAVLSKIESVVCIKAETKKGQIQLSGFAVNKEGLIICTAHNLKNLQRVSVILYDGRQLSGNIIKTDHHRDLALLHIDAKLDTFISLADGRNLLGMGEWLYSVGCPIDLRGTVFPGMINGPPRHVDNLPLWQINMEIHPGSSGSPVFDVQGTLVAIVKGRYRGTDSIGFLIPLETIMAFAYDS